LRIETSSSWYEGEPRGPWNPDNPDIDYPDDAVEVWAAIHLTPEKPEYAGGAWHVEGMMNERIVSTGIYYYEREFSLCEH
jgi:Protein of unknown function (DUF4246)